MRLVYAPKGAEQGTATDGSVARRWALAFAAHLSGRHRRCASRGAATRADVLAERARAAGVAELINRANGLAH